MVTYSHVKLTQSEHNLPSHSGNHDQQRTAMLVKLSQIILQVPLPNKDLNIRIVIFTVQNQIKEIIIALWMTFLK
jgi:hypothetical protein